MIEQLTELAPYLSHYPSALVEAGHFYANEELTSEHYMSMRIGLRVVDGLKQIGLPSTLCLLIDDYNAPDVHSETNLAIAKAHGFNPVITFREKDQFLGTLDIFNSLKIRGKAKIRKKTGDWHLKDDGFAKIMNADGKPTCSLLDAALYCHQYTIGGGICVTVLPDTKVYRLEQLHTKSVLKAAGQKIPILNVYFGTKEEIFLDFDY